MATGAVAGVALVAFGIGATIPPRIEVSRQVEIARPPEAVWWVLTDYGNLALWHPQYRNSAAISLPGDKPVRWRATYTDGYTVTAEVVEETYAASLVEQITDKQLPFTGRWRVELARSDRNTVVTAHSTVELHRPLDRLFVRLFSSPDSELEKILLALKRRVESVTVQSPADTGV
jgi:uncharacterized protein YndB with AHSA1/START domain